MVEQEKRISKYGNSIMVPIVGAVREVSGFKLGDDVRVEAEKGKITVTFTEEKKRQE